MTDGEKYIAVVDCEWEYRRKMPHDVEKVNVVETGRQDHPEVIEIHWKSGGKSGIGNPKIVEQVKPLVDDAEKFCEKVKELIQNELEELRPAAAAEAEKNRPWTYVLGVLDDNGNRVERYSWYEDNSWELYGQTDERTFKQMKDQCDDFRSQSTSRWHVYKRMRGSDKLEQVY
jgi:hypothetical protein